MAKFVFLSHEQNKNGQSVKLYFDEKGQILDVAWANSEYINNKLVEYGVKTVEELEQVFTKMGDDIKVYEYHRKLKSGDTVQGYTLDKPFPTPSEPTKTLVTGKVSEVVDNGYKVAVIVEVKKGEFFTVSRGYSVYDEKSKTLYPVARKRTKLLQDYGVDDFMKLIGKDVTFVRQQAGSNYYYTM